MKVYKFGGASVRDAKSIINLSDILKRHNSNVVVVISAIGKTTREIEQIVKAYFYNESCQANLELLLDRHRNLINELFDNNKSKIYADFEFLVKKLKEKLAVKPSSNYDYEYDQLVAYGELFSTKIIEAYLNQNRFDCKWLDIRESIKTDSIYGDARVNWPLSQKLIQKNFIFQNRQILLTQGFIASNEKNRTTTLGIEGSDFSAAIIAYALDATEMVVWKDVPGFFNSDPKIFTKLVKLDAVSFHEAVELAYYGAKIIHPKTIKPLQNKNIPLYVKSFMDPKSSGTAISASTENKCGLDPEVPIFITKNNQVLISIAPRDFSFIAEDNLSAIFASLARYRIKVNLMQNSAISFSICVDNIEDRLGMLLTELKSSYKVLYNSQLTLITIRHYNQQTIDELTNDRKVFIQQKSRHTVRFVVK
ncbi:MAG: aspartate kinase [Bacteroidota bacterium]